MSSTVPAGRSLPEAWMGLWPCFLLPTLDGAEHGSAAIRRLPVFGKVDGSTAQNSATAKTYVCKYCSKEDVVGRGG